MTAIIPESDAIRLCSYHVQSGKKVFVKTTELNIYEKVADLVFKEVDLSSTEIDQINKSIRIDENADIEKIGYLNWFMGKEESSIRKKGKTVKRVIINYYIPLTGPIESGTIQQPLKQWVCLIPLIGTICNDIFPNLKAEESNFNVHLGFHHYRSDEHFLPDISRETIYIKSK